MSWLARLLTGWAEGKLIEESLRGAAELLGLNPEEVNDPSIKCAIVLSRGLTPEVCEDFREIRRWVLCRAWELLDQHKVDRFRDAVRQAWAEAKLGCAGRV